MKKLLKSDQRGIAHLMLILGIVVIVVIAGVGYYVYSKQGKTSTSSTAAASNAAVVDACVKAYNDKDLCKFSGSYNAKAPYKATFTTTDATGKVTVMAIESDGKGNSSTVTKENNTDMGAYVSLNGDTYMKNMADGTWTKYPKSKETTTATTTESTDPTSDLKVEDTPDANITYKKLGKEKCGNATCFKYEVVDKTAPGTESIVWFGDKDYQLRKWSFKDKDGSSNVGEFTYTSVTISAPSPVKEAPAAPTQAEIEQMIHQAQQDGPSEEE